jgi:predicted O-linked N-acetylglucosamine transferase (SPINDLY family)
MHPPPTITPATRALLEQAIAHHRAGRLGEAEQLYKKVLQAAPREPDANHNLGLIAAHAGRRDIALPLFQTALAVNPLQPQFLASFAGTLLELGRDAEARTVLQRGLADGVRNAALDALLQRAETMRNPNQPRQEEEAALYQLFKLGLHAELQREARRLLEQFPESGSLWKIFGASVQVEGKDAAGALEALRKAAALLPYEGEAQNNVAVALRQQGKFPEAAHYLRHALNVAPGFVEARRNLGVTLYEMHNFADAAEQFRMALAQAPDASTRINLSLCSLRIGKPNEALDQLQHAIREGGESAALHCQMGIVLQVLDRPDEASRAYGRALELDPHQFLAWNNLGNMMQDRHRIQEAIDHYRRALEANPGYPDAHNNLGVALRELGQRGEALASFKRAIACQENFAGALSNMGNLLHEMGRSDEALIHCRRSAEINPQFAEAHGNLGNVLFGMRRYDEALASLQRAVALKPSLADAHSNLGALYRDTGRIDLAVQSLLTALRYDPDHLDAHSGLLFASNFLADEPGSILLGYARRFGATAAKRARPYTSWANSPDRARRLRIGFVSADLYRHPVGFFLESTISALHGHAGLELHAYANNTKHDDLTEKLQGCFASWRNVFGLPDDKLAQQIRDDGIDILIDLSGHTTGTRLSMFAWKPAPVQASWLGYFATTGLTAMDYLVADPWTLLPGEEAHFSEAIRRLPETRLCFSAPDIDVPVGPLPALANGYVTFGCCNNLSKLGGTVLALWARILHAVPESRLMLKAAQLSESAMREDTLHRFAALGVPAHRLTLEGPAPREDYLRALRRIDIALDPFPYTGGTTTAEALWMGVPVLTLAGERFIARQGVSLLANAGLPDWIAANTDDYLAKAVAFASNLPGLALLRAGLREQVLASPLFDGKRFAGHFEVLLRGIWGEWCERQANSGAPAP